MRQFIGILTLVLMSTLASGQDRAATSAPTSTSSPTTTSAPASTSAPAVSVVRVEMLDAVAYETQDVTLRGSTLEMMVGGKRVTVPRQDVGEVSFAPAQDVMAAKGHAVLVTNAGGALAARNLSLTKSRIAFDNAMLGHAEMPMDGVKVIYLGDANTSAAQVAQRCQELKIAGGTQDTIVVAKTEADWASVEGVLKSINERNVVFNWDDADRTVGLSTVRAIWLAPLGEKSSPAMGTLTARDGSMVGFTRLEMDGQAMIADCPPMGSLKFPASDVASISFASGRTMNLGDLAPTDVKEYGLLDKSWPHQVNRSAGGKELRLDGRTFGTGLGLHSFTELSYKLDGAYSTLVALAGIDDSVRPGGDARLTILGDSKELITPVDLSGSDKAQLLRVKVAGVKILTIRVDFGRDKLDVSDHVDLVMARLVK